MGIMHHYSILFSYQFLIEILCISWVVSEMAQEFAQFDLVEELKAADFAAQFALRVVGAQVMRTS